jgi:hypothetical protein
VPGSFWIGGSGTAGVAADAGFTWLGGMAVSARSGVDLHRAVSALSHGQSALFRYRDGQVYLAKCSEPLPTPANRQLPKGADPSTVTVKLAPSGRWFVSLLVDVDIDKLPASPHQVGLDL